MIRRVVLMGKGELAIAVGEWFQLHGDYRLDAVVPVIPEPRWCASLQRWAERAGVRTVSSGDFRDIPVEPGGGPLADLVVSVFYDRILDAHFISRCRRVINIHNGPLPRYRGVSPINWALRNGEVEHGVTIHDVVSDVDAGPIVAQIKYSIYPEFDDVIDVYRRALRYGWLLFVQTMPILERITPRAQDHREASMFRKAHDGLLGDRRGFRRKGGGPR